jgi:hypothetical protein
MSIFDDRAMRQPPHNYEAKQALLAALLANNGVFGLIAGMMTADDFANPLNGETWRSGSVLTRPLPISA